MVGEQSLEEIVANVRSWAVKVPIVSQVYIFGSRVKGGSTPPRDIDIAVRIDFPDPDTAFAHWSAQSDSWKTQLEKLVHLPIDLQWFHPTATPTIVCGLRSAAVLAFRRDDNTFS